MRPQRSKDPDSGRPAGDTRPVTMAAETRRAETGAMGAPGSVPGPGGDRPGLPVELVTVPGPGGGGLVVRPLAGPVGHVGRAPRSPGRQPTACSACCTPQTCTSALATQTSATPRRPARAPVRRVQGERGPRDQGEGRPVPRRGRPVRLQRPAAPSVERVAAELARLAEARIRSVLVPGTHDVYDRSSVYRAYDLAAMAGTRRQDELVTVLTPDHPWIHLQALDAVVHGPCFPTKRAPYSPAPRPRPRSRCRSATWKIGVLHASTAIPGRTDQRRGRRDRSRRSPRPGSTTSRSATGTAPRSRRPRASRTPTRARRSPSPSTRTVPARCSSSRSTTPPAPTP